MLEKAIKCEFEEKYASELNNSCTLVKIDLVTNMTSLSISDLCPGSYREVFLLLGLPQDTAPQTVRKELFKRLSNVMKERDVKQTKTY